MVNAMNRPRKRNAFTLIELLTVTVIIGILVGIVIGVAGNVRQKAAASRAKVEIAAFDLALERYKIDNGDYPNAAASAMPSSSTGFYAGNPSGYLAAGRELFMALCGRTKFTETTDKPIYFEAKESQVGSPASDSYFQDPFGYAYGYVYKADATSPDPKSFYNQVVPDIWSTSGLTLTPNAGANNYVYLRWVTNWGNR